jgi:hypothetical protein
VEEQKEKAAGLICDGCGEPIENEPYGSIGGNWVPFIPPNVYHLRCVPAFKPENALHLCVER